MAALCRLATTVKQSRRPCVVFAGLTNGSCASGAVPLWSRQYSLQSEETSSQEDMPVEMENPYKELPPKCVLCGIRVDYKNVQLLSQFISPYTGRIFSRHITGLCEKKQWEISKAIRRARWSGFMAVVYKDPAFRGDPKICNIKYPE